jgi:hypothetical protein
MRLKDRLLEIDRTSISGAAIIGYNLLAIVSYTVIYAILTVIGAGDAGIFLDFCLVVIHFIFCVLMAVNGKRTGVWPLCAALVFVIGFTTLIMIGLGLKGGV